jgi:hypothetical protein
MSLLFRTYDYKYDGINGKPIFAPSEKGRRIGRRVKRLVQRKFAVDPFFYHLKQGGHVAALHVHRGQKYFARLDLENFFYSIGRNRVAHALYAIEVPRSGEYAKWSCVKNPFGEPGYALPYGFVQSPILASLVLARSQVGGYLRELQGEMVISVYVDDIALSSNNCRRLERAFRKLTRFVEASPFSINQQKSTEPGLRIELFNCHVERMRTLVTDARREEFYAVPRSPESQLEFERYCASVAHGNQYVHGLV